MLRVETERECLGKKWIHDFFQTSLTFFSCIDLSALSNEVASDPRRSGAPGEATAQLAAPVIVNDTTLAVINLERAGTNGFDDSDVTTLETLADQLAGAIENVNLNQQQRHQSQRLAVADERDRIGRDLHDGVIQSMYAVGLTLEDIASQSDKSPEEVRPRIDEVVGDLNQVIRDIRSYISDLRPTELQGRQWDEALASLVRYLEDRAGVAVSVDIELELNDLPERYFVNIWHILQESFSNIEKYAQARNVFVKIGRSAVEIFLTIADDGVGFDLETAELGRGYGLPNIKNRAERLGGMLKIEAASGGGVTLDVRIPFPEEAFLPPPP